MSNQTDALFNAVGSNGEQGQNNWRPCKTENGAAHGLNKSVSEMENPGALAGATGANSNEPYNSEAEYRYRRAWAMALRDAIRECDPLDAAVILSDELERLRLGAPIPPLLNAMDEARDWAAWATPFEIKAYCLACFNAMPPNAQAGFLAYVTGRGR